MALNPSPALASILAPLERKQAGIFITRNDDEAKLYIEEHGSDDALAPTQPSSPN